MAKELEFQLQHQSFNEYFRVDFLAVQGTLKCLHHDVEASIFPHLVAFVVYGCESWTTAGEVVALIDGPLSAERLCLILS